MDQSRQEGLAAEARWHLSPRLFHGFPSFLLIVDNPATNPANADAWLEVTGARVGSSGKVGMKDDCGASASFAARTSRFATTAVQD